MVEITLKEWQKLPQNQKSVRVINGKVKFYGNNV